MREVEGNLQTIIYVIQALVVDKKHTYYRILCLSIIQ